MAKMEEWVNAYNLKHYYHFNVLCSSVLYLTIYKKYYYEYAIAYKNKTQI